MSFFLLLFLFLILSLLFLLLGPIRRRRSWCVAGRSVGRSAVRSVVYPPIRPSNHLSPSLTISRICNTEVVRHCFHQTNNSLIKSLTKSRVYIQSTSKTLNPTVHLQDGQVFWTRKQHRSTPSCTVLYIPCLTILKSFLLSRSLEDEIEEKRRDVALPSLFSRIFFPF